MIKKLNENPKKKTQLHKYDSDWLKQREIDEKDTYKEDIIDKYEIFDIIRNINDPEYICTLEEFDVINLDNIFVDNENKIIDVYFSPTIEKCSFSNLIGLSVKIKLQCYVSNDYKINVILNGEKNKDNDKINRQLADKERVNGAKESSTINTLLENCIIKSDEVLNTLKN